MNVVEHQEHAKHFHLLYQMCKNGYLNQVNPIYKKIKSFKTKEHFFCLFIPDHPNFHEELMLIAVQFEFYYYKQVIQLVCQHFLLVLL